MNFFKLHELYKYEYKLDIVDNCEVHILYFTLVLITERKFNSRLKTFLLFNPNPIVVEFINATSLIKKVKY